MPRNPYILCGTTSWAMFFTLKVRCMNLLNLLGVISARYEGFRVALESLFNSLLMYFVFNIAIVEIAAAPVIVWSLCVL